MSSKIKGVKAGPIAGPRTTKKVTKKRSPNYAKGAKTTRKNSKG